MKKFVAFLFAALMLAVSAGAKNPDPRDYTRSALGFYGNVKKAVLKSASSTITYTFNAKGNILQYKLENQGGAYVQTYDFKRDANGNLTKLVIKENGKLDSFVVYGKGEETLYSFDDFLGSITVKKDNVSYVYDATEKDTYKGHPENAFSTVERIFDKKGRLSCIKVITFGEESDRKEFFYDKKGRLSKTITYIDGEPDSSQEFSTNRKTLTSYDGEGNVVSTSTVRLYYFQ